MSFCFFVFFWNNRNLLSHSPEAGSPVAGRISFSEGSEGECSYLSTSFCGCITPIFAPIFTWPSMSVLHFSLIKPVSWLPLGGSRTWWNFREGEVVEPTWLSWKLHWESVSPEDSPSQLNNCWVWRAQGSQPHSPDLACDNYLCLEKGEHPFSPTGNLGI